MNRRAFLRRAAFVGAVPILSHGFSISAAESDAELLRIAYADIERHRRGAGAVVVRNPAGQPVSGARVRLEQVRHEFLFGCNLFMWGRLPDPALEEGYRRRFSALLNFATLGFYWWAYERERGRPDYDYSDRVTAWCREQQIRAKGHPLAWDYADPRWLPRDFEQIRNLSHDRVRDIIRRFAGRIDVWDVVNEPTHLGRFGTRMGEWAQSLGAIPYTLEHLRTARAAGPRATLLVNDYRADPKFYEILDALRNDGRLAFDVIGIQSHMHGGSWPLARIREVCDRFRPLKLPIHFTETTLVSGPRGEGDNWRATTAELEARQADYVPKFYTMLFADPDVQAITWWDFSDRGAWQRAAAGFLRDDMSPKPVYDRLHELIRKQWWTRHDAVTNPAGELELRAFYGRHRVEVELPDGNRMVREIDWLRGQENRHVIA